MNNRKAYTVSIAHNGREMEDAVLGLASRSLTVGRDQSNGLIVSIPSFPDKCRLVERTFSGYRLRIPKGVEGTISIGKTTLPLDVLQDFGFAVKKGEEFIFPLPDKATCVLSIGDYTFTIGYKDLPPRERRVEKVDRSLKKSLVSREDYSFLYIVIVSLIINFALAGYLNTVKIRKKDSLEALKELPQRFAKLVLQPPKVEKKVLPKAKPQEGEKNEVKEEAAAKKEEKKQTRKEEAVPAPATEAPAPAEGTRHTVREAVKSKGLLGVIMAKARTPEFLEQDIFKETDDAPRDVKRPSISTGTADILSDVASTARGRGEGMSAGHGGEGITSETGTGSGRGRGRRDAADIIKEKKDLMVAEIEKAKPQQADPAMLASLRKRDEAEIYKTIMSYIGGLKYLYNNALRKDATLKGKISVKIVVGQDGKVRDASMISSTLNNQELEEAMLSRIQKWKFPELQGGEDFPITYTFDFSPVG